MTWLEQPRIEEIQKARESIDRFTEAFAGRVEEDKRRVFDERVIRMGGLMCICGHQIIGPGIASIRMIEEALVRHFYQYHSREMGVVESGEYGETQTMDSDNGLDAGDGRTCTLD
jgi:hypothetical protein